MELERVAEAYDAISEEVGKAVVGQPQVVEGVLVALFARGSVLLEGPPGLGKTLLVNVLSRVISCDFKRVQFTPDLMPSDLVGHNVYDMGEKRFRFTRGPLFTNLLLADEINRSPAKTQSALLEVMQEEQITVDGTTYPLEPPFLTIATQNPLEHEGTYPLPEAQIDRFMMKLLVDYPDLDEEQLILELFQDGRSPRDLDAIGIQPILTGPEVVAVQRAVNQVHVERDLLNYVARLVQKTREWHTVSVGASPRASINLLQAARALAACRNRNFVIPDDVKELAPAILRHRLRLSPDAEIEGVSPDQVIAHLLDDVEAPAR